MRKSSSAAPRDGSSLTPEWCYPRDHDRAFAADIATAETAVEDATAAHAAARHAVATAQAEAGTVLPTTAPPVVALATARQHLDAARERLTLAREGRVLWQAAQVEAAQRSAAGLGTAYWAEQRGNAEHALELVNALAGTLRAMRQCERTYQRVLGTVLPAGTVAADKASVRRYPGTGHFWGPLQQVCTEERLRLLGREATEVGLVTPERVTELLEVLRAFAADREALLETTPAVLREARAAERRRGEANAAAARRAEAERRKNAREVREYNERMEAKRAERARRAWAG